MQMVKLDKQCLQILQIHVQFFFFIELSNMWQNPAYNHVTKSFATPREKQKTAPFSISAITDET